MNQQSLLFISRKKSNKKIIGTSQIKNEYSNLEHRKLQHKTDSVLINSTLPGLEADVLVLTESNNRVAPANYKFWIQTPKLSEIQPNYYLESEKRKTSYTNYEIIRQYERYDRYTYLSVALISEHSLQVPVTIREIYTFKEHIREKRVLILCVI